MDNIERAASSSSSFSSDQFSPTGSVHVEDPSTSDQSSSSTTTTTTTTRNANVDRGVGVEEIMEEGLLFPVHLNVYDINTFLNRVLRWLGLGFYNSCVQVHGQEYMFRANDGVVNGDQQNLSWCQGLNLRDSIMIGETQLNADHVREKIEVLKIHEYGGDSYHRFTRNCHHFSNRFCKELTGNGIPTWINRINRMIWSLCKWILPPPPPSPFQRRIRNS